MFNFYATQFLLEVQVNQPIEGVAEKLAYGGKMMIVGMGVIFSVLILLWFALALFNLVFSRVSKEAKPAPAPKQEAAPIVESAPVPSVASNEQDEIIAVIAAAIAAVSAENPSAKFRVVSFKRK